MMQNRPEGKDAGTFLEQKINSLVKHLELLTKHDGTLLLYAHAFSHHINIQTESMVQSAIEENGLALEYVTPRYLSADLCRKAVKNNGDALKSVPKYILSKHEDIIVAALLQKGTALQHLQEKDRTKEFCRTAIHQDGLSLEFVPQEHLKDPIFREEIYLNALNQNGESLKFIPHDKQDENLCVFALKNNAASWYHIAPHLRQNKDVMTCAVKNDGLLLQDMKPDNGDVLDYALCLNAVKQTGQALTFVPQEHWTDDMCFEALKSWRRKYEENPRSARLFLLPSDRADALAKAIGIRFNKKNGRMYLAPINEKYLKEKTGGSPRKTTGQMAIQPNQPA